MQEEYAELRRQVVQVDVVRTVLSGGLEAAALIEESRPQDDVLFTGRFTRVPIVEVPADASAQAVAVIAGAMGDAHQMSGV